MAFRQQQKYMDDTADPYHEYFDIQAIHQNSDNTPTSLRFNETRNAPYLLSPEKYFMSIIRFNVSTELPVFIPKLKLGQTDPDLTDYSMYISLSVIGDPNFALKIQFKWETQGSIPPPVAPGGGFVTQDLSNDYYYCYTYQYFLSLMNKQIAEALESYPASMTVWFELDPSTYHLKLNFLVTDESYEPKFYFNNSLKNLFSLFPYKAALTVPNYGPAITEQISEIQWYFINNQTQSITVPLSIGTDACCLSNWNPVSSIVFTTTTLPVVSSQESRPLIFGTNSNLLASTSNNNISPILTDFTVPIGPNNLYTPEINYVATGVYRLNDLFGDKPISNIDLAVWWKDRYNNYHPLLIPSGGKASIKILFRKKNFNISSRNLIV